LPVSFVPFHFVPFPFVPVPLLLVPFSLSLRAQAPAPERGNPQHVPLRRGRPSWQPFCVTHGERPRRARFGHPDIHPRTKTVDNRNGFIRFWRTLNEVYFRKSRSVYRKNAGVVLRGNPGWR
jgi:hypothetical protein